MQVNGAHYVVVGAEIESLVQFLHVEAFAAMGVIVIDVRTIHGLYPNPA